MESPKIMKKVVLIFTAIIFLSLDCNCQWYHRQYGVNNIFQLTPEQFNEALMKAKIGVRHGTIMSTASSIGIVGSPVSASAGLSITFHF
jgi:hypothetical protein